MNRHARRGFALPVAIFALVVLGVLLTGGFFMARQQSRISVASENSARSFYLAERGNEEIMSNWQHKALIQFDNWADTTVSDTINYGDWSVTITKMTDRMYYLDAVANVTEGGTVFAGAQRRVGTVGRVWTLDLNVPGALTTRGTPTFQGSPPLVTGEDSNPTGWNDPGVCISSLEDQIGILTTDSAGLGSIGRTGPSGGCPNWVAGSPCIYEDADSVNTQLGTLFSTDNWDELVALADITIGSGNYTPSPSLTGTGDCNEDDPNNWGDMSDPSAPCGNYFPIIYGRGNITLTGTGQGQGILLVEGVFSNRGTFDFAGIVIVNGEADFRGTMRNSGGILADTTTTINGTADLEYSSCAVERAIMENSNATRLIPLPERGWIDISSISY